MLLKISFHTNSGTSYKEATTYECLWRTNLLHSLLDIAGDESFSNLTRRFRPLPLCECCILHIQLKSLPLTPVTWWIECAKSVYATICCYSFSTFCTTMCSNSFLAFFHTTFWGLWHTVYPLSSTLKMFSCECFLVIPAVAFPCAADPAAIIEAWARSCWLNRWCKDWDLFRKQCSTTDQMIRLETFFREAFIHKQHAVAVFFDLEKAYDATWKYHERPIQCRSAWSITAVY